MTKSLAATVIGLGLALATPAFADITVGSANTGNCYPFMCNDTGVTSGESIDYQQVYGSSAFGSGSTTITSISFSLYSFTWSSTSTLTGTYDIYLGYSTNPVNGLSTNLTSNVASEILVATYTGGGSGAFTVSISPFVYNPGMGDLLLEVIASNQANVPNDSTNGYNNADGTGTATSRAYCLANIGCTADGTGLVTTFGTASVPEPGTLALLGAGLAGLAAFRRRRTTGKKA